MQMQMSRFNCKFPDSNASANVKIQTQMFGFKCKCKCQDSLEIVPCPHIFALCVNRTSICPSACEDVAHSRDLSLPQVVSCVVSLMTRCTAKRLSHTTSIQFQKHEQERLLEPLRGCLPLFVPWCVEVADMHSTRFVPWCVEVADMHSTRCISTSTPPLPAKQTMSHATRLTHASRHGSLHRPVM
eukprot:366503-Chlamydomonas_euryale.AAC.19